MNTFENVVFDRKDGVEVYFNEKSNEVVVLAPNQYDLTWQLKGKNQEGEQYSDTIRSDDTKKREELSFATQRPMDYLAKKLVVTIPAKNLDSPEKQQFFNNKVKKTRERVVEAAKEYNQFFFKKDPDGTHRTKTPSEKLEEFSYKAAFDEPGNRKFDFHFAKNDKNNPILAGEVAHADKYYVVLYTGFDKENVKFEIINTGKFLKGEDLKDQNRATAIAKVCPVGEKLFIDRDKLGNVLEVSKEPIPIEKNHPEIVAINKAVEQAKVELANPPKPEPKPEPEAKEGATVKKAPAKKKAATQTAKA